MLILTADAVGGDCIHSDYSRNVDKVAVVPAAFAGFDDEDLLTMDAHT